ncbi:MAG: DUF2939 domain-containing protein [Tagaea sp.]
MPPILRAALLFLAKWSAIAGLCAAIWAGWAYLSVTAFLDALARGDRQAVEDHVDRAAFQRTLEAALPQRAPPDSPVLGALAGAGARFLGRAAAEVIPTYDMVAAALPKDAKIAGFAPTAPTRVRVTLADPHGKETILVFAFRDLGWYLIGVR